MRVSIITVCYNSAATIADTINSVRAQTYGDYEHLIIDGGSKDGTVEIVERLKHDKLTLVSEPDRGLYDAMNKGLTRAKGDIIGTLNSDDFYCRIDALSLLAAAAEDNPDADAISMGTVFVSPHYLTKVTRVYSPRPFWRWMLRFGHMPPHPGFYVRRPALLKVGLFDLEFRYAADFDWMVRFYYGQNLRSAVSSYIIVSMRSGGLTTRGWSSTLAINREIRQLLRSNRIGTSTPVIWSRYAVKIFQKCALFTSPNAPDSVRWTPCDPLLKVETSQA